MNREEFIEGMEALGMKEGSAHMPDFRHIGTDNSLELYNDGRFEYRFYEQYMRSVVEASLLLESVDVHCRVATNSGCIPCLDTWVADSRAALKEHAKRHIWLSYMKENHPMVYWLMQKARIV
jgi:hypothetical protein